MEKIRSYLFPGKGECRVEVLSEVEAVIVYH
jgi:hypothetical protein